MKLWRYIQGFRKGKEANRLEKEAMSDPFLAQALRGFDRVEGDHVKQIEQIREQIRRKTLKKPPYIRATAIAASVLLIVGVGIWLAIDPTKLSDQMPMALYQDLKPDTTIPSPPPPPVLARTKFQEEKPERKTITRKSEASAEQPLAKVKPPAFVTEGVTLEEESVMEVDVLAQVSPQMQKTATTTRQRDSLPAKRKITGTITDPSGEPLVGVNVIVDNTTQGTITDLDGRFQLTTDKDARIKINYIGYEPITLPVDTGQAMHIAMHESQTTLEEVVVTGYGSQRKAIQSAAAVTNVESSTSINQPEPQPVDGKKNYHKYIKENLIPPTDDACRDAKGKVILRFYINRQGRPINIVVERSLCPSADQEAIRLVTEGPDWIPGDRSTTWEIKF